MPSNASAGYGAADQKGSSSYPSYGQDVQQAKAEKINMRRGDRNKVLVFVLLPWLSFSMVMFITAFAHYEFKEVVYSLDGIAFFLSLVLFLNGLGAQRGHIVHIGLGILCCFAVCTGVLVGLFVDANFASAYYRLDNGAAYRDVEVTANATGYADATELNFKAGTIVYSEATVGYMEGGEVFCVAPVVSNKDSNLQVPPIVQYWAVGKDCCSMRGDFECDDAASGPESLGASVIRLPDRGYRQAVRMMPAVHGLASEPSAIFVKWVKDPDAYRNDLLRNAVLLVVGASIAHLCASAVCGIGLAYAPLNAPRSN